MREPADIASKMLVKFDIDPDGMLYKRELAAMFDGIRKRLPQTRNGLGRAGQRRVERGRAGQSGAGQGRTKAARRGSGAGGGRFQPLTGRRNEPKSAGLSAGKSKRLCPESDPLK